MNKNRIATYVDLEEPKLPPNSEFKKGWRFLLYCLLKFLLLILYRPKLVGKENIPNDEQFILIANHKSAWDPILIIAYADIWPDWIGKESLFRTKLMAKFMMSLGVIPVDRKLNDITALRRIMSRLMDGRIIGLFPEGTRLRTYQDIIRNKPKTVFVDLAKKRKIKILPIAIDGKYHIFRPMFIRVLPAVEVYSEDMKNLGKGEIAIELMRNIYQACGEDYPENIEFI